MSAAAPSLPSVPATPLSTRNDLAAASVVLCAFGFTRPNADAFARTLYMTRSALFGGAALTWWKAAAAPITTTVPEGQDIDIFVPVPAVSNLKHYPIVPILRGYYTRVLETAGYHRQTGSEQRAEKAERRARGELAGNTDDLCYSATLHTRIQSVQNFYNPEINRKIQLVFCYMATVDEFLDHVDLDICRFTVRPAGGDDSEDLHVFPPPGAALETLAAIECGEMRLVNTRTSLLESTLSRVSKYYKRGYTLHGSIVCTHCKVPEERALTLSDALAYTQRKFLAAREAAAAAQSVVKKAPVLSVDE
jgi:hypothetical protein